MENQTHAQNQRVPVIQVSGLKKQYKLGQIGGGTLTHDLQSWWARVRGKEDPNTMGYVSSSESPSPSRS